MGCRRRRPRAPIEVRGDARVAPRAAIDRWRRPPDGNTRRGRPRRRPRPRARGGQRGIIEDSKVVSYLASNVKDVCCFDDSTYVLDNNNVLRCFGANRIEYVQNKNGKMIQVDDIISKTPRGIEIMSHVTTIQKIESIYADVLAIELYGEIYLSENPLRGDERSNIVTIDQVFINKNGRSQFESLAEDKYWALYKLTFTLPHVPKFSHFKTLEVVGHFLDHYIYIVEIQVTSYIRLLLL